MKTDRIALAKKYGWTIKEIYSAKDAWRKAIERQPTSTLSFQDYLQKLVEAKLRPSMIGLHHGKYSLARYGDTGGYTIESCRFITIDENVAERKPFRLSAECRSALSVIAKSRPRLQCPHCEKSMPKSMLVRWHGENCRKIKDQQEGKQQ